MKARRLTTALAIFACSTLAACGLHHGRGAEKPNPELITHQQLTENRFVNAYQAVEAMRPNWLVPHGPDSFSSPSEVLAYLDNVKLGSVTELRSILTPDISFLRHYDGVAATTRFGVGHAAGVIQVSTFTENRR